MYSRHKSHVIQLILIFLLLTFPANAGQIVIGYGGGACKTPASAPVGSSTIFAEGFEGTGYEGSWTVVNAGADPDATNPDQSLSGSCLQSVRFNNSSTYSLIRHAFTSINFSTNGTYFVFYHYLTSAYSNGQNYQIFVVNNSTTITSSICAQVNLYNSSGTYNVKAVGTTTSTGTTISTGAWHKIVLWLDTTAANSYIQVDGGTQYTFTRNTTNNSGQYLWLASAVANQTNDFYMDLVYISQ